MKRAALIFGLIFLFAVAAILYAASRGRVGTECDPLMQAVLSLYQQANYSDALVQAEQAVECCQEIGDRAGEGTSLNSIGVMYERLGQYEQALNYHQQALAIMQEIGSGYGEALSLNGVGAVYADLGQYESALDYFQQALAIVQEISDRAGESTSLNNIGLIYLNLGQYEPALDYHQQALAIQQEIGDGAGEGNSLNNIGGIYYDLGQYELALDYFQQALTIRQEIGDRAGVGNSLNTIGGVYDALGQYEPALDYYQQALAIRQEIGDRDGESTSLNNIGGIYYDLGQYEPALDYYQQALAIRQEIGDRDAVGNSLNNIGVTYLDLGQYEPALDYYQQALAIQQEIGDRDRESASLNNIGAVYHHLGEYEPALDYYQQALAIAQEIGDRDGEGASLNNIGGVYHHLGEYEPALDYYQQALAINQEIGDRAGEGTSLNSIGVMYECLGQYEQALNYHQRALAIMQEIGDRDGEGNSLNNIGLIYSGLGQYELALDYYQQGLAIVQEIGAPDAEGASLNNIGLIYLNLGQYEPALDYHQQALAIQQEIGDRAGEGTSLSNIGLIYGGLGQYEPALDYYQQALAIQQEIGDRVGEGNSLSGIGLIYYHLGQYEPALDLWQQALAILDQVRGSAGSEVGRIEFIAQYIYTYRAAVALSEQIGQSEAAFHIAEQSRGRAFLDSLTTGQVRLRDDDAAALLAQEQQLHLQRQTLRFELAEARATKAPDSEPVVGLEARLAEAEAAYAAVQAAIAARSTELASLIPGRSADYVLDVKQVQQLLDDETTLISFFLLDDKVLAFLIRADSFVTIPLEASPEALLSQIVTFHDFANVNVAHPASAVALYEMLIAPLKDKLTTPHLTIIPHNFLHYLPFAALTDGQRYLIDDYSLSVLPSASVLPFIRDNVPRETAGSPLILGNPLTADFDTTASLAIQATQYRDRLGPLPYAEKESKAIAALFGVEPLLGRAATESALREQVSAANILHLAAHGTYNPVAPLHSLIALAPDEANDGWLTVGEVYGLDLENADLVVLSACQTHLGQLSAGDELVGLTRAFVFAGTPSVMASLWQVDDQATSLLMERFYTHLKEGRGKAAALRQAQLEVREQYPNPYYWAAFVLSGAGGEIGQIEPGSTEAETVAEKALAGGR